MNRQYKGCDGGGGGVKKCKSESHGLNKKLVMFRNNYIVTPPWLVRNSF
jgi:hypothetical protein